MTSTLLDQLSSELAAIRQAGGYRSCTTLAGSSRAAVTLDGLPLVSFSSNDYLGLSTHPRVIQAASEAVTTLGLGAGSSRLLAGTFQEHRDLENRLASLVHLPAALLFPSGYQANLAAITALSGNQDLIVADRAVHASILDACRLSRAKLAIYPHLDADVAERHLRRLGPLARRRFLVTESLFSMDGDVAPLLHLSRLAANYDAIFYVDEAHAIGTMGSTGSGLCAQLSIQPDVLLGTLGKALGASGAFIAGSQILAEYLVNRARPFIFSTSLPIPVVAAANAAARLVLSPEGSALRSLLHLRVDQVRATLHLPPDSFHSPIIPLIVGESRAALQAAAQLRSLGFFVPAIRPPTVHEGTARLRLSLSALHTPAHVASLCEALRSLLPSPSATPSRPPPVPPPSPRPPSSRISLPAKGIFLAGTDTSVGKTAVAQALLHLLATRGYKPVPFKPVETGALPNSSDAALLRAAAQRTDLSLDTICPFSFPQPIAAAAAAPSAGSPLTLEILLDRASAAASLGNPILVESSGGLLSPYAANLTSADLASALGYPVLLVARNALGTINHTALTLAELRRRSLFLLGILLVDTTPTHSPDRATNPALIAATTGISPLGVLPFLSQSSPPALAYALQAASNLDPILSWLST